MSDSETGAAAQDNPFSSGVEGPGGEEPASIGDLVSKTTRHVLDDFVPWLVGGLPFLGVVFVAIFVGLILVYGGMFGGMAIGMAADDENLAGLLAIAGMGIGTIALVAGLTLITAPMTASIMRAVWRYLETGEKLTIGAGFSTIGQDFVRVVMFQLVFVAIVTAGSMFCYVPGLIAAAALSFAWPAVVIHRLPVGAALGLSVSHFQRHMGWHAAFFGVGFVIAMVLGYLPFIGYALVATIHPLFVLLAYREAFGSGELPRGYAG